MKKTLLLIVRVIIAIILAQTLYFKFTAHPESVYIFEKVGMEPFGRIGIGILELIASILLLIPRTIAAGATLAFGLMSGALYMHLTKLGIEVNGSSTLFMLALITFILSFVVAFFYRKEIPIIGKHI